MPRLRAVLVMVPPLLAEMLRGALAVSGDLPVAAELDKTDATIERLRELAPDAVILGPGADALVVRTALPAARILALSPDLKWLDGPGPTDRRSFSAANLALALLR